MRAKTPFRVPEGTGLRTAFLVLALALPADAQLSMTSTDPADYRVLYAFPVQYGLPGSVPYAFVIPDSTGNLYGTTLVGGQGAHGGCPCGVIFELNGRNKERVVYNFDGVDNGAGPWAAVIRDANGTLYGTAASGGASGYGTVIKVDHKGHETLLHAFTGSDGAYPVSALVMDAAGDLYGTTMGCNFRCGDIWGTVFKLDPTGDLTTLHSFTGGSDGGIAQTGLIMDADGSLYGATSGGGPSGNAGVVYKIDAKGNFTVRYGFTGGSDGNGPSQGNLIEDSAGNLYGTTQIGGDMSACDGNGCGVVFMIDPHGNETVLYSFKGGKDWGHPNMPLVRDAAGNLYGTSYYGGGSLNCGGAFGCGTVFKVDTSGHETVLHRFRSGADGANPLQGLVADAAGNVYGTTQWGGDAKIQCGNTTTGCGSVFKLGQGQRLQQARAELTSGARRDDAKLGVGQRMSRKRSR